MPITKKQELSNVPISKLMPYAKNPRKNDAAVKQVAASLKEFGLVKNSIVVDEDMVLITGHTTTKAMQVLGWKNVPEVTQVFGLTAAQKQAYRIADNKLGELAEWDTELLGMELEELRDLDFDIELTGFDDVALDKLFPPEPKEVVEDDFEPPAVVKTDIKLGDIIQLGRHRLMCGDSTSMDDVERLMDGVKADMIFTDPPYNVDYGSSKNPRHKIPSIENDSMPTENWSTFCHKLFEIFKVYNKGDIYMWGASGPEGMRMRLWLTELGCHWSATIIWKKNQLVLTPANYQRMYEPCFYGWFGKSSYNGDRTQTEVWDIDRPRVSKLHPTMKPINLCQKGIENSSIPKSTVLDLFLGSGSTLIACEQLDRTCYGMEISPQYCQVIIDRWEKFTGMKAEQINHD